ncbi:MAG: ABC transporter substrate-binding protein [Candidatus Heimdallarchaeota archaeon]
MKKVYFSKLLVAVFLVLIMSMVVVQSSFAEKLRIGVIYPMSGSMALLGNMSFEGADVARKEQNEKGGLLGKEIEYVVADAPDAKAAVAAAERLITVEKVKLIIGSYSSSLSFAATNVANKHGVVYWELGAISDPIVERGFKYVFRTCPAGSMYSYNGLKCMAEYFAPKLGKKPSELTVAIVYEDSLFGTTMAKYGHEAAKKYGIKVVSDIPYNHKSTDLTSVILKLKVAKPDFLLYPGYFTDQVLFFRQSKELRFNFKAAITVGGSGIAKFGETLGHDSDAILCVGFTALDINPNFAKGIDKFKGVFNGIMGKDPDGPYPLMNYMGTKVLYSVIEKAGSLDAEAIRKAALTIDIPMGGTQTGGGMKFDPKTGQNTRAITPVAQWQEGGKKLITVWPEEAAVAKMIFPFPKWKERK